MSLKLHDICHCNNKQNLHYELSPQFQETGSVFESSEENPKTHQLKETVYEILLTTLCSGTNINSAPLHHFTKILILVTSSAVLQHCL